MATVRMTKNGLFADVFDSEETIANAQKQGWAICQEKPIDMVVEEAIEKELEPMVEAEKKATSTHKRASSKK